MKLGRERGGHTWPGRSAERTALVGQQRVGVAGEEGPRGRYARDLPGGREAGIFGEARRLYCPRLGVEEVRR